MLSKSAPLPIVLADRALARTAVRCVLALVAVVAAGCVGFYLIEPGWGLWKSLYFTLITVTTVGYGDEGLSDAGEKFAVLVLIVGIGTVSYAFSSLMQVAVSWQIEGKRRMHQEIAELKDHSIICGYGRMGSAIAEHLRAAGAGVVVVERDERGYEVALDAGFLAIHGEATDDEVLRQAGICRARNVVCALNSDADNTFVTLSARELNDSVFIASRADSENAGVRMQRSGASLVVSPHITAGVNIATAILRPNLAEFLQRAQRGDDQFSLGEVAIHGSSSLAGRSIAEFGKAQTSIVFVAIRRGNDTVVRPGGSERLQSGDVLIVAGPPDDLSRMVETV